MAQLFPKRIDSIPKRLLIGVIIFLNGTVFLVWYFFSPEFTDVGYAPEQPVPFSHRQHGSEIGLDCQYCHTQVFDSNEANIPATQPCTNCRNQIAVHSEALEPVRVSWGRGGPIEWVGGDDRPGYAYLEHEVQARGGQRW